MVLGASVCMWGLHRVPKLDCTLGGGVEIQSSEDT